MSDNILYKFAKDLSQLYSKVRIKDIEDCFLKIAQSLDFEVENWLSQAIRQDYKRSLKKPEVLDTLILLARLRKSYAAGIDSGEFVKIFINDSKLKFFIPIITAIREVSNSNDFAILSPYKNILNASQNLLNSNPDTSAISSDLSSLDRMFREEMNRKVNKAYEDNAVETKKKITKKERISGLLHYLTRRFSEEISIAFESTGQIDIAGIADDPLAIRNPVLIIKKMFPDYPPQNIPGIKEDAESIVKDIIKYSDPQYYDYVFNYVRNRIMNNYAIISDDQFNEFNYEAGLKFYAIQDDENEEAKTIDVPTSSWSLHYVLILLSMVLYILGTKSQ